MNQLSAKRCERQRLVANFDEIILGAIRRQCNSHSRRHSFDLGSTRRSHVFQSNETYLAPSAIARQIGASRFSVQRAVKRLVIAGVVKCTTRNGWSSVTIVDDCARIQDVAKLYGLDESLCGTDRTQSTVDDLQKDRTFPLRIFDPDREEHESASGDSFAPHTASDNSMFSSSLSCLSIQFENPSKTDTVFSYSKERKILNSEGRRVADDATSQNAGNQQRETNNDENSKMLFDKTELPEEKQTKRTHVARVLDAEQLKSNASLKRYEVKQLAKLNDRLAELEDGVLGRRPRRGQVAKNAFTKWRDMFGNGMRSCIRDLLVSDDAQDELIEAIKRARMCHGQPWFTFEWLLSFRRRNFREDMYGEPNVAKLLDGEYDTLADWVAEQRRLQAGQTRNYAVATDFDPDADWQRYCEQEAQQAKGDEA